MPTDTLTIFHISDLHVEDDDNFLPDKMEALIALINDAYPDLLVISGDFVVHGTSDEFQRAYDYVQRMQAHSYLYVPGNHDLHPLDADPLVNYRSYFGEPFTIVS